MKKTNKAEKKLLLDKQTQCIDKKTFVKAFTNEISNKEKLELLDHITFCSECNREFDALKEVWAKGKILINNLEGLEITSEETKQLQKVAKNEIRKIKLQQKRAKRLFFYDKRILATVSGTFLILAIISAIFLLRGPREIVLERKPPESGIELIEPRGQIDESPLVFKWSALEKARYYSIEILDKGLETIYAADNIEKDSFVLPEEVFKTFRKGEIYFWKVTAITDNNEKIESNFRSFNIIPD